MNPTKSVRVYLPVVLYDTIAGLAAAHDDTIPAIRAKTVRWIKQALAAAIDAEREKREKLVERTRQFLRCSVCGEVFPWGFKRDDGKPPADVGIICLSCIAESAAAASQKQEQETP